MIFTDAKNTYHIMRSKFKGVIDMEKSKVKNKVKDIWTKHKNKIIIAGNVIVAVAAVAMIKHGDKLEKQGTKDFDEQLNMLEENKDPNLRITFTEMTTGKVVDEVEVYDETIL